MDRIFITITRSNGEMDRFRFEPNNAEDLYRLRAMKFLFDQYDNHSVMGYWMSNKPNVNKSISDYDVIED